jgi:hypothetical protein
VASIVLRSQDSAVIMATAYRTEGRVMKVWISVGAKSFSYPCHPYQLWGPHILLSNGYQELFLQGKSCKVKNTWIYSSAPHMPSLYNP